MGALSILVALVAAYAGFWVVYLLVLPALALFVSNRRREAAEPRPRETPSMVVLIPAHDLEALVGKCLESLQACRYPNDRFELYVIADHCTDDTAGQARAHGAVALERNAGPPGKTYALAWALSELAQRGVDPDVYVIVDATAYVDAGFLAALAEQYQNGEDIIVGRATVDPRNQQWFAQSVGLSLSHRSLQNWSRERLRLSSLIQGCGMAYGRRYIRQFGWSLAAPPTDDAGSHPTEDWRHGVRIVEHGLRVSYADGARVFTPLRDTLGAATRQGIRWERGRIVNAWTYGLRLLRSGLRQRDTLKVMGALDAIQPPVAVLGGVCGVAALLGLIVPGPELLTIVGFVPLALVAIYGFAVVIRAHREGISAATIAWVPVYVAWRCLTLVLSLGPSRRTKPPEQTSSKS